MRFEGGVLGMTKIGEKASKGKDEKKDPSPPNARKRFRMLAYSKKYLKTVLVV